MRENRASQPLLPPALLQSREFTAANLLTLLLYGAFAAVLFLLPFDLIARRGLSASEAGLLFLPIGLVIGTASRTAGRWADRVGPRMPLMFGSAFVALAATLLAFSSPNLWLGALGPILLMAIGMAMVVAPLTTAVMNAVAEAESGIASAVNNAASRLAGLISVVVVALAASLLPPRGAIACHGWNPRSALWRPAGPVFASKGSARSRVSRGLWSSDADCRRPRRSRCCSGRRPRPA